ncbi:hypothetical protein JCM19240_6585 [Vibrio maritimus]|uniref:Uncharacterized protein n=1 Tax=Vibrio maritimus TaxID=990268 RepID=A0A090T1V3_9VIBR|nr:hypothetical protein JCM19240_6585 [Vibrio maritimus]
MGICLSRGFVRLFSNALPPGAALPFFFAIAAPATFADLAITPEKPSYLTD